MKIVFIGAGNLATSLGHALFNAGHDIVQVYSHTMEHASLLANAVGGSPIADLGALSNNADIYIISVKDSVMAEIIPAVTAGRGNKVFVHTAGSIPMDIFRGMALHYGVLYPMQSFSKSKLVDFSHVPCFIEGNDEYTLHTIGELASTISDHISELSSDNRRYLHLAAVFACNFTNLCYSISADILEKHGLPFDIMLPLISQTASKVQTMRPIDAQTGPAVRFDRNVIRQQSALLSDNIIHKDLYERMSVATNQMAKKHDKL